MKPKCIGLICARGGSKGVHRKNIRKLAGMPLIGYAIKTAQASTLIESVYVSTDDEEIASVAREYGAEVPFTRPSELAKDDTPEWKVWQHAIRNLITEDSNPETEIFVSIPPTSPLRAVDDVDACIRKLWQSKADIVITVKPAERNPYFNMVVLDKEGFASLAIPGSRKIVRRQDAPAVYDMATVAYAARPEFILKAESIFEGRIQTVVIPPERAIDIDTEFDFKIAEFLSQERNIKKLR